MKPARRFASLTLVPLLVAGCTINKVWVANTGNAGAPTMASDALRSYAGFTNIDEDFRIQGMISATILPPPKNRPETRGALLRETAANLGANALVGLTSFEDFNVGSVNYGLSCAILVKTGAQVDGNEAARPKFIVCALPVRVNTDKAKAASRIELHLIPELQFHFAKKGYYTYQCESPVVDLTGSVSDMAMPVELKEPLGVEPDFALTCEIKDGKELGLQTLQLRVALHDLQQRETIWEEVQTVVRWGLLEQLTSPDRPWFVDNVQEKTHEAVKLAINTLPPVSGFRKLTK